MKNKIWVELPDGNWISELEDKTVKEAIEWLKRWEGTLTLSSGGYYDELWGVIGYYRPETDEEEAAREAKEAAEAFRRELLHKQSVEKEAERMKRLQLENTAVYAYVMLHKDNPQINDLENLFRAIVQLEGQGQYFATVPLKSMLKQIEDSYCPDGY